MIDAYEQRAQQTREQRSREKRTEAQFRADVQAVLNTEAGRRLVMRFLTDAGVDSSAYRDNPTAMAHAAGWRDGGQWWLEAMREHCPEKEAQMRAEAKREARDSAKETEDDDRNDD